MKQDFKRRWVKALRSGMYQPISGVNPVIRYKNMYNIYGILYDINLHIINHNWEESNKDGYYYLEKFDHLKFFDDIELTPISIQSLNNQHKSFDMAKYFEEAADWIEKHL